MTTIKAQDLINIYISLFNYKKLLIDKGLTDDAQEIQYTIEYIINLNLTEITPLGRLQ